MTPARVRRIRRALGFTQEEFARTLWVTYTTLNRWEAGRAAPTGMHLRILRLLEENVERPSFRAALRDRVLTIRCFCSTRCWIRCTAAAVTGVDCLSKTYSEE
jgi:transcriptional regulator with XRE-family HTH domain